MVVVDTILAVLALLPAFLTMGVSLSVWLGPLWLTLSTGITASLFMAPIIALLGLV